MKDFLKESLYIFASVLFILEDCSILRGFTGLMFLFRMSGLDLGFKNELLSVLEGNMAIKTSLFLEDFLTLLYTKPNYFGLDDLLSACHLLLHLRQSLETVFALSDESIDEAVSHCLVEFESCFFEGLLFDFLRWGARGLQSLSEVFHLVSLDLDVARA